ncbi:unnamed protein product [Linum tenue]|uniref:Uncharacterized protein n=1 Tax=Linum tenue TaxID=586396 RepID=A0AAV0P254_9ROSI|nr:unnamed protein product [Linum tenue]
MWRKGRRRKMMCWMKKTMTRPVPRSYIRQHKR